MTRLFVDTNVLVDFLARREPFFCDVRDLMARARAGAIELWMSSSQVADLAYILSNGGRASEQGTARAALRGLCELVHVCAPGEEQVDDALDSQWVDFEDAFVYEAARLVGADCIVTRDGKGFERSRISALNPPQALARVAGAGDGGSAL